MIQSTWCKQSHWSTAGLKYKPRKNTKCNRLYCRTLTYSLWLIIAPELSPWCVPVNYSLKICLWQQYPTCFHQILIHTEVPYVFCLNYLSRANLVWNICTRGANSAGLLGLITCWCYHICRISWGVVGIPAHLRPAYKYKIKRTPFFQITLNCIFPQSTQVHWNYNV